MLFLATALLAWEGIWEGVALRTGYEHSTRVDETRAPRPRQSIGQTRTTRR